MGLQRRDDRGQLVQPAGAPPRLKVRRDPDGRLVVGGGDPGAPAGPDADEPEQAPQTSGARGASEHDAPASGAE